MRQHHLADTIHEISIPSPISQSIPKPVTKHVGCRRICNSCISIYNKKKTKIASFIIYLYFTLTCKLFKLFLKEVLFLLKDNFKKNHTHFFVVYSWDQFYNKLFRLLKREMFNNFFKYCTKN